MRHKLIGQLLAIQLFFVTHTTIAADFVLEIGIHFGGDDLRVTNVNETGAGMNAGELMSVAIGGIFNPTENLELQATFGLKYDIALPFSDNAVFTRSEANLLAFYRTGKWRFGGGLTRHQGPKLDGDDSGDTDVDFDDATGALLELGYSYVDWAYIGVRYTFIDYETKPATGVNNVTVDGNSFGIIGALRF